MNNKKMLLTVNEMAKIHNINKRTLHYYDDIKLFSPNHKSDNGYRYYDVEQSIELEYLLMLKDLNMTIKEIAAYKNDASCDNFISIADEKIKELNENILKLKRTKKILETKKNALELCKNLNEDKITIETLNKTKIAILPFNIGSDDITNIFTFLKDKWDIEQIRVGIGSIIDINKIYNKDYANYDGIYTYALDNTKNTIIREKGKYLVGYIKGEWEKAPQMYEKMLKYAKDNNLMLEGYAYEMGLNEFAIKDKCDYVTKILIKIKDN